MSWITRLNGKDASRPPWPGVPSSMIGLRPDLLDRVQDVVRDPRQRLVPGDALPLPFAALAGAPERVQDALRRIEEAAPGGALLAAHGVHVRHAVLDYGQVPRLLFGEDDAVLHEHPVGTVPRVAVHAVRGPGDLVPPPALAVQVLRALVLSAGPLSALLESFQRQGGCEHETAPSLVHARWSPHFVSARCRCQSGRHRVWLWGKTRRGGETARAAAWGRPARRPGVRSRRRPGPAARRRFGRPAR